jgi:predicted permease
MIRWAAPRDRVDDMLGDLEEVHDRRVGRRGAVVAAVITTVETAGIALAMGLYRLGRASVRDVATLTELRLALRLIARHPFMSATSVLALAVGITIATAGFTVLNSLLNPVVPLADGHRLVEVRLVDARTGSGAALPAGLHRRWREGAEGLRHLSAVRHRKMNLRYAGGDVEMIDGAELTPGTFEYLPYRPLAGRRLSLADARPGAEPVVLLRESLWRRQFGAALGTVGRSIDVNGTQRTIVGVLPDTATFPTAPDLWMPLSEDDLDRGPARDLRAVSLNAVLADGVEPEALEAELTALLTDLPRSERHPEGIAADVRRVGELDAAALPGGLMVAVLGALLMVVAANVGNLVVARNASRRDELAVRSALGAGRRRIVVQLTLEVLVMVAIAAIIGLLASNAILTGLGGGETEDLPPWVDFTLNVKIAAFVVFLAALATLFAGLLPALRATRGDLGAHLHAGPGGSLRHAFGRRNDVVIVAQIALSVGILGAASMIHLGWAGSYARSLPDVPVDRVLTARITLAGHPEAPDADFFTPASAVSRRQAILSALRELPDATAVGAGTHIPGTDAMLVKFSLGAEDGESARLSENYPTAWIDADYLAALQVETLAGRAFAPEDYLEGAVAVALVNQSFVDRQLAGRNPVGLRLARVLPGAEPPVWHEIVGVLPDLGMSAADPERSAGVYLPLSAQAGFWVFLHTSADPASLASIVQRRAYETVADASVDAATVLGERIELRRRIFMAIGSVVSSLGGMVMLLSLTAIYAILSFEVTRRTPEFGIRAALGASRSQVARPVLRRIAGYIGMGGVLGCGLGAILIALARGLFVMRFPPTGVWLFAALLLGVALAAAAAGAVPLLRALRVDPMQALRVE